MDVYVKKKKRFQIDTIDDLEDFIRKNEVKKFFIKFPSEIRPQVLFDISNTKCINLKELKTFFLSKYFKSGTLLQKEYWIERGHSEHESLKLISYHQKTRAKQYSINRKLNPKKYTGIIPNQPEYWEKLGFSKEESVKKVSDRQSTFSRKKLIQMYGEEIANEKIKLRNEKWMNTLIHNNDWNELSLKKGRSGLNQIKTLTQHILHYGECLGKIKFAKRYWGIDIESVEEFDNHVQFLSKDRTHLFYDKEYRATILEQQTYSCGECGAKNTDRLFHLHHIDFDKKNDSRDNLIFLCHSCHSKTTNAKFKNRDFWINHYKHKNREYYDDKT